MAPTVIFELPRHPERWKRIEAAWPIHSGRTVPFTADADWVARKYAGDGSAWSRDNSTESSVRPFRGNSDFFNYLPERWGRLGLPLGNVA
jgi:hypothetical protein